MHKSLKPNTIDIRKMLELLFVYTLSCIISCIYLLFVIIVCSIDFYVMKKIAEIN